MGEKTPATTDTNQSSNTNPWSAASPLLQSLIDKYSGVNTAVTSDQTGAAQGLMSAASSIPNLGPDATAAIQRLFSANTTPQAGMLSDAYGTLQKNIGGTAAGDNLDPYSVPGFGDALKTATGDITNAVKGVYAGSGRSPSGAGSFAQSLGRGLTQGLAPTIQSESNFLRGNQMNAASTLFGGAGSTASGITQQQQVPLTDAMMGLQGAGMLPGLYTAPAQAQFGAANTSAQLPFANLAPLLTAGSTLGGMGSSSTGSGTSTSKPANDPLMNYLGAGLGAAGLMFSDERLKENIEEVGELHDGQKVYRFNFKGDHTPTIGLMAQEVAEHEPDAVHDLGGVLAVDYEKATRRAGMLREAA